MILNQTTQADTVIQRDPELMVPSPPGNQQNYKFTLGAEVNPPHKKFPQIKLQEIWVHNQNSYTHTQNKKIKRYE